VKSDCSGIKVGNSYCVEVTRQAEPTSATATSAATTPTPTKVAKPSPTQEGLIDTCTNFYFTVANDNCEKIAKKFGTFSASEFISWNPAVGDDCNGIWAKTYYCVGIPGTPTAPVATATAAPTSTGSPKPSPTQEGLIDTCTNFYLTVANDNCEKIAKKYGTFSAADFIKWNSAVGSDCSGIWAKTYYCVGVPGTPTAPVTTSNATPTGSPKPSPTQEGLINTCTNFYFAVANDSCEKIAKKYGTFSAADFIKWNPAVGSDCSGIWAKTYYCVGVPGTPSTPPKTTTPPTTTKPTPTGNGISTPLPSQPGMVNNCDAFYLVPAGGKEGCQSIADKSGITLSQFLTWNPDVGGKTCGGLWANAYVCVSTVGHTPSKPAPTTTKPATTAAPKPTGCQASHPEPTQPGSVCGCQQWYKPAKGEFCYDVQKKFKISAGNFNKWNPGVGSDCAGLWKDTYVCVKN
jgi:hypothetical protein